MNELKSVLELFQMGDFMVPDYQRGYSWENEQLEDFFQDLNNIKSNNHYMGWLTLKNINTPNNTYEIIDGQQRILTILILLKALIERNQELGKEVDTNKKIILDYISEDKKSEDKKEKGTYYFEKFKKAEEFFKEKLNNLKEEEQKEIFNKTLKNLVFNCHIIEDEYNAYVMFETINNRGKKLSNLELLKNRLIYLTTLLDDSEKEKNELRKNISLAWKEIYYYLGKKTKKLLPDDEFLNAHWIVYMREHESQRYDDVLFKKFSLKEIAHLNYETIKNYIENMEDFIKYWYYTFYPEDNSELSDMEIEWLNSLNRIGMTFFRPLIAVILKNRNTINKKNEEKTIEIFKSIERFIFIIFKMGRSSSSFCATDIRYYARNIYNTKKWKDVLQENMKSEDNSIWSEKIEYLKNEKKLFFTLIEDLIYFLDTTIDLNLESCIEKFITEISSEYKNGFYSWDGLKYFLEEYEYHISYNEKNDEKNWNNFIEKIKNEKLSIEHIIPQTLKKNHKKEISAHKGLNKKQKLEILSKALGNFLLISNSLNSKLQNSEFKIKRDDYIEFLSSIEVANSKNSIDVEVEERSKKLLDFMQNRWLFSYYDDFFNYKVINKEIEDKAINKKIGEFRKLKYKEWLEEENTKNTISKLEKDIQILADPISLFRSKK